MTKKKNTNTSHLQKIERAKQRNEYIVQLKQLCDQITRSSVFSLIPSHVLDELFLLRSRSIKVMPADGHIISTEQLEEIKSTVSYLKNRPIGYTIGSASNITMKDYFTHVLTLILYGLRIKDTDYPHAVEVKQKLAPLVAFGNSKYHQLIWQEFNLITQTIGIIFSNLSTSIYTIRAMMAEGLNGNIGVHTHLYIYCSKAEKVQVKIDETIRPSFRLGWPLVNKPSQTIFAEVKSELLNLPSGKTYPVYIQSHALERLSERLDGIDSGFLNFNACESFKNLRLCKNKKGEWLFEYKVLNKKLGYLVGDLIDDKIILRTFLFLTNNGTPEGEQLHAHTGIMKEDKMYLTIDKLSSFVHSDIRSNERVKAIFIKAGCQSLFELDKEVFLAKGQEKRLANLIENYLNKAA